MGLQLNERLHCGGTYKRREEILPMDYEIGTNWGLFFAVLRILAKISSTASIKERVSDMKHVKVILLRAIETKSCRNAPVSLSCLFVSWYITAHELFGGFSWNLILMDSTNICWHVSVFVKIGQQQQAIHNDYMDLALQTKLAKYLSWRKICGTTVAEKNETRIVFLIQFCVNPAVLEMRKNAKAPELLRCPYIFWLVPLCDICDQYCSPSGISFRNIIFVHRKWIST